jgi:hypothetical protein
MNQRKRTRVQSRKPVTMTAPRSECQGEIINVSLKGCLLGLPEADRPEPGVPVSLTIHLEPGTQSLDIAVRGRVVRNYPDGVAIEFTEIPPESFSHLFRLVQYNAPDPEGIEKELGASAFGPTEGTGD